MSDTSQHKSNTSNYVSVLSNIESQTSTLEYEHEAFDTFQSRAVALAREKLWPDVSPEHIFIERLKGGGYNRILGLNLHEPPGGRHEEFVLRIPRFEGTKLDREVAIHAFVRTYTSIPSPDVISFDDTNINAVQMPYMIQRRLSGTPLLWSYPSLSQEQKCKVAKELGSAFREMLKAQSREAGYVGLSPDQKSPESPAHIIPFHATDSSIATVYQNARPTVPAAELLVTMIEEVRASEIANGYLSAATSDFYNDFSNMASEIAAGGWLDGMPTSLAHLDFHPRNILINAEAGPEEPIISGILDWDISAMAPSFVSCAPPLWIWAWEDDEDEDEDESTANDVPPTAEGCQLKQLFENAAGPDYVRLAYPAAYRFSRRLFVFARQRIGSNEGHRDAKAMLKEWAELPDEEKVAPWKKEPDTKAGIETEAKTAEEDESIHGKVGVFRSLACCTVM